MITRDEIRAIPELHKSIQRDMGHLDYLREKATSVPSGISDGERVQTSPKNDGNKYVEAAVDLCRDIQRKEAELEDLQARAKEFISTIGESLPRKVMTLRYLDCCEWDQVADLAGYTERRVQQVEFEVVSQI